MGGALAIHNAESTHKPMSKRRVKEETAVSYVSLASSSGARTCSTLGVTPTQITIV